VAEYILSAKALSMSCDGYTLQNIKHAIFIFRAHKSVISLRGWLRNLPKLSINFVSIFISYLRHIFILIIKIF